MSQMKALAVALAAAGVSGCTMMTNPEALGAVDRNCGASSGAM